MALDQASLLAHLHVLEDGADGVQRRPQGGGRDDEDPRPVRFLDGVGEVPVQLGIDRLRGQEHERGVGRFAHDHVAPRDVADMGEDRRAEGARRRLARVVAPGLAQRVVALQRALRVDGDGARRVRERQQAVGAAAVGKRRLEAVGRRREDLAHQVGQLDFAEGTAHLLVGEDVLKAHHLAGKRHDVFLRLVDHGEPPFEARHRLQRAPGGGVEAGAQSLGRAPGRASAWRGRSDRRGGASPSRPGRRGGSRPAAPSRRPSPTARGARGAAAGRRPRRARRRGRPPRPCNDRGVLHRRRLTSRTGRHT